AGAMPAWRVPTRQHAAGNPIPLVLRKPENPLSAIPPVSGVVRTLRMSPDTTPGLRILTDDRRAPSCGHRCTASQGWGMPSIRQELEATPSARWYRHASGARRAGAWADRERDYAALRAVLAEHTNAAAVANRDQQPPVQLAGLLSLVAKRAHYAGAEPVYRRYRGKQGGAPILRWAGCESPVRRSAAFLAEARIAAFWPYREGVLKVADACDMTRAEWATAYLQALAAWAAEDRALAAYIPAGAPLCVPEDMAVLANVHMPWAARPAAAAHAERLAVLAGDVVRGVLSNAGA